jgi:hypothetical protein
MHVIWQNDDGIDRERPLTPCPTKGLPQEYYVADEPLAPSVRERNREKIGSSRHEVAAIENHCGDYMAKGAVLSTEVAPDYVALHPGYMKNSRTEHEWKGNLLIARMKRSVIRDSKRYHSGRALRGSISLTTS